MVIDGMVDDPFFDQRRDDDRRNPDSQLAKIKGLLSRRGVDGIVARWRGRRRQDMIIKSTMFIEGDEQHRVGPYGRYASDGLVYLFDQLLTFPDIIEGMHGITPAEISRPGGIKRMC